jgi:hypothetical protein
MDSTGSAESENNSNNFRDFFIFAISSGELKFETNPRKLSAGLPYEQDDQDAMISSCSHPFLINQDSTYKFGYAFRHDDNSRSLHRVLRIRRISCMFRERESV